MGAVECPLAADASAKKSRRARPYVACAQSTDPELEAVTERDRGGFQSALANRGGQLTRGARPSAGTRSPFGVRDLGVVSRRWPARGLGSCGCACAWPLRRRRHTVASASSRERADGRLPEPEARSRARRGDPLPAPRRRCGVPATYYADSLTPRRSRASPACAEGTVAANARPRASAYCRHIPRVPGRWNDEPAFRPSWVAPRPGGSERGTSQNWEGRCWPAPTLRHRLVSARPLSRLRMHRVPALRDRRR